MKKIPASMFSPEPVAPYRALFPLNEGTGETVDTVFGRWLEASPVTLGRTFFHELEKTADSLSILIRVGDNEPYQSFLGFSKDFSDTLTVWGIKHDFATHSYGHSFNEALAATLLLWADSVFSRTGPTSTGHSTSPPVQPMTVEQAYPSPFNSSTTFNIILPAPTHVTGRIYDLQGREVALLVSRDLPTGRTSVGWNAGALPSGIYLVSVQAHAQRVARKVLLLR